MTGPQLRPRSGVPGVPWVAAWGGERDSTVLLEATWRGLHWWNESPRDRDRHGALWSRKAQRIGVGKPEFAVLHPRRQRLAMERLLCHVCGGPASLTDDGVLWMEPVDPVDPDQPLLPHTTNPPVCEPCAIEARDRCPRIRRTGAHTVRAVPFPWGVHGTRFVIGEKGIRADEPVFAGYDDPELPWVLAWKQMVELSHITPVDLDEEYARYLAAGSGARTPGPT